MATNIDPDLFEIFKCPVCIDKIGVYALIECGHNLCSDCIRGINNSSAGIIKCPMCRVVVTKKPIIFQPLASHLEDGSRLAMNAWFENIFNADAYAPSAPPSAAPSAAPAALLANVAGGAGGAGGAGVRQRTLYTFNNLPVYNPSLDELQLKASTEFNYDNIDWFNNVEISTFQDLASFKMNPYLGFHNDEYYYTFIKSSGVSGASGAPIIFEDTFKIIEKRRTIPHQNHRRVILILENLNIIEKIQKVEYIMKKANPNCLLRTEINSRANYQNTLAVHSGLANLSTPLYNQNFVTMKLKIAARFGWIKEGRIGVRWHIVQTS